MNYQERNELRSGEYTVSTNSPISSHPIGIGKSYLKDVQKHATG